MAGGVCIAGIPRNSKRWVRPVRQSGQISKRDLFDANQQMLRPLDLVTFDLVRQSPNPPHVEDWATNFSQVPVIEQRPSERQREDVLGSLAEASPDDVLLRKSRSLVLIEPDQITSVSFDPLPFGGNYKVLLRFSLRGTQYDGEAKTPGYPCTDLKLRNWGRRFKSRRVLGDRQLRDALGVKRIFLVMGLARWFNNNYWPMVVGFLTCPDFSAEIDLSNP